MSNNFYLGMVSVTFRKFSIDEVIEAAIKAELDGIEWGGDIHVPHGDIEKAKYAFDACEKAGLSVFSYGSYYRAGQGQSFMPVLETAAALHAPNIRIWAGSKGSADSTEDERKTVTDDIKSCVKCAKKLNINVSVEYHGGTLTDDPDSALRLYNEVGEDNFTLYWQPNQFKTTEFNIEALKKILPALSNVHVFAWEQQSKFALAYHAAQWADYINIIKSDDKNHGLFLEFSPDDSIEAFYSDAKYLREITL